jgi:hypothetical protein
MICSGVCRRLAIVMILPSPTIVGNGLSSRVDRSQGVRPVPRSVRTHLIAVPGRLVNRSGTPTLRGPRDWPWAQLFTRSLACLRNLQPVPM